MPNKSQPAEGEKTIRDEGANKASSNKGPRTLTQRVKAAEAHVETNNSTLASLTKVKMAANPLEREENRKRRIELAQLEERKDTMAVISILVKAVLWVGVTAFLKFDLNAWRGAFSFIKERASQPDGLDFFAAEGQKAMEARYPNRTHDLTFAIDVSSLGAEARAELKQMEFRVRSKFYPNQLEGKATVERMRKFAEDYTWTVLVASKKGVSTFAESGVIQPDYVGTRNSTAANDTNAATAEGELEAEVDALLEQELDAAGKDEHAEEAVEAQQVGEETEAQVTQMEVTPTADFQAPRRPGVTKRR